MRKCAICLLRSLSHPLFVSAHEFFVNIEFNVFEVTSAPLCVSLTGALS